MLKESELRKIIRESIKETLIEATTASDSPGPKGYAAFLNLEDLKAYIEDLKKSVKDNTGYNMVNEALSNPMSIIVKNDEAGPLAKLLIRNRIKFSLDSMTPVGTEYHVNGADYGKVMKLAKGKLVYEGKPPTDATIKPHMNTYTVADDPYDVAVELGKKYNWNTAQIEKAEKLIRKKYIMDSVNEEYSVAGRPVELIKGKKSDGTDWKVKFKNGKEVALADVLALIKPFPKGINEANLGDKLWPEDSEKPDGQAIKKLLEPYRKALMASKSSRMEKSDFDIAVKDYILDFMPELVKDKRDLVRDFKDHLVTMSLWKESVNETSTQQAAKELAMAAIGSMASGGGYGPFEKIKRNTWKNTNTSKLVNSDTLATRIAGFNDFMVMEGSVNESKYVVQYWKYTRDDDYDLFDKTVNASSEDEAIKKVQKLDRRGKDFKVIKKDGKMIKEGVFSDKRELVGYEVDAFVNNYKKINPKNMVKDGGDGFVYGFRKGDKVAHWKLDKASGKIYSDSNSEVGNLIHRTSGAKIWK